jgi:hypothetical protein
MFFLTSLTLHKIYMECMCKMQCHNIALDT